MIRWHAAGAPPDRAFEDIEIGETVTGELEISEQAVALFAQLSGDQNPLHMDEAYAQASPFGRRVVHGMLVASHLSALCGMRLPGRRALLQRVDVQFVRPVFIGDRLRIEARLKEKSEAVRVLTLEVRMYRGEREVVTRATVHATTL